MRFAVYLFVLLLIACVKQVSPDAMELAVVTPESLVAAAEQPEPTPEPEKPLCSEEGDHTLNLTTLKITQGVDGMTPISWIYRDVNFVDGSKHEVTCLTTIATSCVFGSCTDFTKCCDRSLDDPGLEPETPKPDESMLANQAPKS